MSKPQHDKIRPMGGFTTAFYHEDADGEDADDKAVHPLEKVLGRKPTPGEKMLFEEGVKYGRNGG